MTKVVQVCLFCESVSPNITPLLDSRLKPDEVVFVLTKDLFSEFDRVATIAKARGVKGKSYLK